MIRNKLIGKSFVSYKIPVEVLLSNYLREDFQKMLKPVYVVQNIFLASKYTIRDNFITPNGILFTVIINLGLICALIFKGYYNLFGREIDFKAGQLIHWAYFGYCLLFMLFSFSFILTFSLNVIYGHKNITLLLKIQKIHENINIAERKIKVFKIWSWISILSIMFSNTCLMSMIDYSSVKFNSFDQLCTCILIISFDINIVYSVHIIKLLTIYLEEWNKIIHNDNHEKYDGEYYEKLFDIYQNVLDAFKLYCNIFQLLVSSFTVVNYSLTTYNKN